MRRVPAWAIASFAVATAIAAARRAGQRADPRYCYDCAKPIIPGTALCAECFEVCTQQRRQQAIARGES